MKKVSQENQKALFERIRELFSEIPFNQLVGLEIPFSGHAGVRADLVHRRRDLNNSSGSERLTSVWTI